MQKRCDWVTGEQIYIDYHDTEWGVPQHDSQKLFEKLCLESQQAGLSWITVLKKRDCYRQCFHHFDPKLVAAMTPEDVDNLMLNKGLIRYRAKLEAIISNAKAYLLMQDNGEDFARFIWSFVGGKTKNNQVASLNQIPTRTDTSDAMAKALKSRGFKFIGTTSCYAFMQSMGLVNDHLVDCCCYKNN